MTILKSSLRSGFLWQFIAGFALGAAGLTAFQPASDAAAAPYTASAPTQR